MCIRSIGILNSIDALKKQLLLCKTTDLFIIQLYNVDKFNRSTRNIHLIPSLTVGFDERWEYELLIRKAVYLSLVGGN